MGKNNKPITSKEKELLSDLHENIDRKLYNKIIKKTRLSEQDIPTLKTEDDTDIKNSQSSFSRGRNLGSYKGRYVGSFGVRPPLASVRYQSVLDTRAVYNPGYNPLVPGANPSTNKFVIVPNQSAPVNPPLALVRHQSVLDTRAGYNPGYNPLVPGANPSTNKFVIVPNQSASVKNQSALGSHPGSKQIIILPNQPASVNTPLISDPKQFVIVPNQSASVNYPVASGTHPVASGSHPGSNPATDQFVRVSYKSIPDPHADPHKSILGQPPGLPPGLHEYLTPKGSNEFYKFIGVVNQGHANQENLKTIDTKQTSENQDYHTKNKAVDSNKSLNLNDGNFITTLNPKAGIFTPSGENQGFNPNKGLKTISQNVESDNQELDDGLPDFNVIVAKIIDDDESKTKKGINLPPGVNPEFYVDDPGNFKKFPTRVPKGFNAAPGCDPKQHHKDDTKKGIKTPPGFYPKQYNKPNTNTNLPPGLHHR